MPLNWEECVICQKATKEVLKCPLYSLVPNSLLNTTDYTNFLENVEEFCNIGDLPMEISSNVTLDNMIRNRGSWHKSCHLKFTKSKLEKAKERYNRKRSSDCLKNDNVADNVAEKHSNRFSVRMADCCMFCNNPSTNQSKLLDVRSLTLDKNIRRMAVELEDWVLLGRISDGNLVAIEAKYQFDCLTSFSNRYRSLTTQRSKD